MPLSPEAAKHKENVDFSVKFIDMGNACYADKHFTENIQTRPYRSPEVIMKAGYDTSTDMWSFACMVFELITGDYLFEPIKGKTYKKNYNHLAQMTSLIGECNDTEFLDRGKDSYQYFEENGDIKKINEIRPKSLYQTLISKYRFKEPEARGLSDFLGKMLQWNPNKRATA